VSVARVTANAETEANRKCSHGRDDVAEEFVWEISRPRAMHRKVKIRPVSPRMFGENFTTEGLDEDSVHALLQTGIRFQDDDIIRRFLGSGRTGFYLAVQREGTVGAGDKITVMARDPNAVAVSEITRLFLAKHFSADDVRSVRRVLRVTALPESWKDHFGERLQKMNPYPSSCLRPASGWKYAGAASSLTQGHEPSIPTCSFVA
jgi:MOSC domain-containing protein YiiM